jgi:ribosomal protein L34E
MVCSIRAIGLRSRAASRVEKKAPATEVLERFAQRLTSWRNHRCGSEVLPSAQLRPQRRLDAEIGLAYHPFRERNNV